MYIQERPDGNLILLGSSFDFQTDTAAILYRYHRYVRKIIHEFKDTRNYEQIEYWRCKPTLDGNIICAGDMQRTGDILDDDLRNGMAHKLNMDGKILWEQEYSAVDSLVELFFNLGLSRDGGFYFGGISWLPEI
ncbi:MAG: hypothetical protein IPM86_08205 [Saprospiraceae bacterium]|nr:hypothetical protein [Saprospiraceae bacterium]